MHMRSVSPARRGLPADEPADDRGAAVLEPGPPAAGQGARARGQHAGLQTHGLPARRRPPLDLTYIHTYIHTLRILPATTVPVPSAPRHLRRSEEEIRIPHGQLPLLRGQGDGPGRPDRAVQTLCTGSQTGCIG